MSMATFDLTKFWDEFDVAKPATDKAIDQLEKQIKYPLPPALRKALRLHNGGYIQDEDICILGAGKRGEFQGIGLFAKVFKDYPDLIEIADNSVEDHRKLVVFAKTDDEETFFMLDYHKFVDGGAPTIIVLNRESLLATDSEYTFSEFFGELLASDPAPAIEYEESQEFEVLYEEVIEATREGVAVRIEQRLCDSAVSLVLFTRESHGPFQRLVRCEIIKPLSNDMCVISPGNHDQPTFELVLAPVMDEMDSEEDDRLAENYETTYVHLIESRKKRDGTWKNTESVNNPNYGVLESADRDRLVQLRTELLEGQDITDRAKAQEQWISRVHAMDDDQLELMAPQMMLQMLDRAEHLLEKVDPAELPPEMRNALSEIESMRSMLGEEVEGFPNEAIDPELQDIMRQMLEFQEGDEHSSP
ncbi:MAG: SMI1/KNR4 family protein [Planctomycetaceae bacterium]|nr:SMI1/KNR4 family protein [Planctomycetaceae bacterium]